MKLLGKLILLPFIVLILFITGIAEAIKLEPDIYRWKDYNEPLLDLLPWR